MSRSDASTADPPAPTSPTPAHDRRLLGAPAGAVIAVLLAARLALAIALVTEPRVDGGIRRFEQVATSPVAPYRYFAVEWMPLHTAIVLLVGGDGAAATAARVAVIAFVADAAVAAALAFGWGPRHAAIGLLMGLPLVTVSYARLDLVAVALASWAFALARRRREAAAGAALSLGILSGLWVAFLAPLALLGRRRIRIAAAAAILLAGGLAWYLLGGPKGPMQVLSYRGATGWDVQGTIGAIVDASTSMAHFVEGGIRRIGYASPMARSAILVATVIGVIVAWWRRRATDRPEAVALTVTAAILALTPTFPPAWAAWLVPWAAATSDEDRGRVGAAWLAIVIAGAVVALGDDAPAITPWLVLARAGVLLGVAAAGLRRPAAAPTRSPGRT